MPRVDVVVRCPVHDSFRVQQVAGMFDVPLAAEQTERFTAEVPGLDEAWEIGLVVGPSGSGKSTIARRQWPAAYATARNWPQDRAVIDGFSAGSIKEITGTLTAVGFSSPPHWIKPYHVLSNGERFRCELARAILEGGELVVFDEFTSVVDRTVARIGIGGGGQGDSPHGPAVRGDFLPLRHRRLARTRLGAGHAKPDPAAEAASATGHPPGPLSIGRLRRGPCLQSITI